MSDHFKYNGYLGSAEVSVEDGTLHGKLLYIRDVVTYEASTIPELELAFKAAVDDYLQTCRDLGDEPDTPCKGTFNVRVGPDRHRDVAIAAREKGVGLNEFICAALDSALGDRQVVEHFHKVEFVVSPTAPPHAEAASVIATAGALEWESSRANTSH